MRREGRQHGMVRSYWILPSSLDPKSETRYVNRLDSPLTAGLFVKVGNKPTNHSKFTGKCTMPRCNSCHLHPSCKSKDKTKGAYRLKHSPIMDRPSSTYFGLSATDLVDHLSNNMYIDDEIENEIDEDVNYDEDNNDPIRISEIEIQVDQVENENEDWFLVELSS